MTGVIIVGAGLSGLIAANMLQRSRPVAILEQQSELPNNHSAVLRFRSNALSDILNIPFKKVTVIKSVVEYINPVASALAYSFKNTGTRRSDRSIIKGNEIVERFIAPGNLIQLLAERVVIHYNKPFEHKSGAPVISTIPMPALMKILDYPHRDRAEFRHADGVNIKARISNCDAYVSLAVPDPNLLLSRISITGNELIVEVPNVSMNRSDVMGQLEVAKELLGIDLPLLGYAYPQKYAKILPIDDDLRRDFIHWATDKHNIYSLGRFATWRPGLLLDDLANDVRLIEKWITKQDRYSVARAR